MPGLVDPYERAPAASIESVEGTYGLPWGDPGQRRKTGAFRTGLDTKVVITW